MRKQLFSVMLGFCAFGSLTFVPTPAQAVTAQAPTIKIKGSVVDEQGEPLIGATVKVKGAQTGVVTDFDGNFSLDAPANSVLIISYVGYNDREVAVNSRAIIDKIQLESNTKTLDQLVVVGYGTQKKADLTGSLSVVNAEQLKKVSNSNI